MSNILSDIFLGWKNLIWVNPEAEILAIERIKFCAGFDPLIDGVNEGEYIKRCDFFTDSKTCEKCGCYMPAKIRSPNANCPENKW